MDGSTKNQSRDLSASKHMLGNLKASISLEFFFDDIAYSSLCFGFKKSSGFKNRAVETLNWSDM